MELVQSWDWYFVSNYIVMKIMTYSPSLFFEEKHFLYNVLFFPLERN